MSEQAREFGLDILQQHPVLSAALEALPNWEAQVRLDLPLVLAGSDFVLRILQSQTQLILDYLVQPLWWQDLGIKALQAVLSELLPPTPTPADFDQTLRQFRNLMQVRIIWRMLAASAPLEQVVAEVSGLAEVCIQSAVDFYHQQLVEVYGEPIGLDGQAQSMVVIAMGKLGAGELNLSSDVDLIFAFDQVGETQGPKKISCHEFFVKLGQKVIAGLDQTTAFGFVCRVDMRLRPFGQSGALAVSFDELQSYYEVHGRDWERYAWIKGRAITGSRLAKQKLAENLRPFIYRRYIDYGVFDGLRKMKAMIVKEVARNDLSADIKLGSGGIREVEFFIQSVQLIRGGRDESLQTQQLLPLFERVQEGSWVLPEKVPPLKQAYIFLRDLEHRIQALADQQTQQLPSSAEGRQRVAWMMGCSGWDELITQLDGHRRHVENCFNELLGQEEQAEAQDVTEFDTLWQDIQQEKFVLAAELNLDTSLLEVIKQFKSDRAVAKLDGLALERLDLLMPQLIAQVADSEQADVLLKRLLQIIHAVLRRSAYIALLNENPSVVSYLVILCEKSGWIADLLARYPILLDELLEPEAYHEPPGLVELASQLQQNLLRVDLDDLEAYMDRLRWFQQVHSLICATSEVTGTLPLMRVSDYLTQVAETLVENLLQFAWEQMIKRFGLPESTSATDPALLVVAYGKLGGIELGYDSDLDLVFLNQGDPQALTDGEQQIEQADFYTRLIRRIIHMMTQRIGSGRLYEIDLRLRPSGASGLMVSDLEAFRTYQLKEAWTWEHQALVRARPVAGNAKMQQAFRQIREDVLCLQRDPEKLRFDVCEMRDKMRDHLGGGVGKNEFHLKQSPGGLVDIEFLVQFGVLRWAHTHPGLTRYTDNMRILDQFAEFKLMDATRVEALQQAYIGYRSMIHHLKLDGQEIKVGIDAVQNHLIEVVAAWNDWLSVA